ncbi:IS110 family transposase [Streptomyces chartreusis]|uniref:IS110 family transposase n=1 Tax=Streptomyces chartreusis TaxID=1969 RepID=UPI00386559C5
MAANSVSLSSGGWQVTWALDMAVGGPGLLIAMLVNHGQELVCIPGIAVNRASDSCRGAGKTDDRDARVIADQAHMRRDSQPIRPGDDAGIELRLLTERRVDLVADLTRTTNRLKDLLNSMFPALEHLPAAMLCGHGPRSASPRAAPDHTSPSFHSPGCARARTWTSRRTHSTPSATGPTPPQEQYAP